MMALQANDCGDVNSFANNYYCDNWEWPVANGHACDLMLIQFELPPGN